MIRTTLLLLLLSWPSFGSVLKKHIQIAAHRYRLDPLLIEAIMTVESNGETTALSPKGAQGLMQIMPPTAKELGVINAFHPLSNLLGGCEYFRSLLNRFRFDLPKALAAYNAGPAQVERYGGIPPFSETRKYVARVLATYERLKKN